MIKIGGNCTVFPDNQVRYEIIKISNKTFEIKIDDKTEYLTNYLVDLMRIDNPSEKIRNVPVHNINMVD